jgi:hypothetical protein
MTTAEADQDRQEEAEGRVAEERPVRPRAFDPAEIEKIRATQGKSEDDDQPYRSWWAL